MQLGDDILLEQRVAALQQLIMVFLLLMAPGILDDMDLHLLLRLTILNPLKHDLVVEVLEELLLIVG